MDDENKQQEEISEDEVPTTRTQLSDEDLDAIAGGFNPQPDPPGVDDTKKLRVRKAGGDQQV